MRFSWTFLVNRVNRLAKLFIFTYVRVNTRRESYFTSNCPKIVIKTLGYVLTIRVGMVSRNIYIFIWPYVHCYCQSK